MKKYILIPVILFIASITAFFALFSSVWGQRTDVSVTEETLFGDKEAVSDITLSVTEVMDNFDRHSWNIRFSPADTGNPQVTYKRSIYSETTVSEDENGSAELRVIQPNIDYNTGRLTKNSQKLFGKMVEDTLKTTPWEMDYSAKQYEKSFRLKPYMEYLPLTLSLSAGRYGSYGNCYLHTDSIPIPVPESASAYMAVEIKAAGNINMCILSYDMDINQKGIITGNDAYIAVSGFSDGSPFPEGIGGIYHLPVKEVNKELSADKKELRKICPLPADEMPLTLKKSPDGKKLLLFTRRKNTIFLSVISRDDGSLLQKLSVGELAEPTATVSDVMIKDDHILLMFYTGQFFFLENKGDKFSLFTSGSLTDHNVMTLNETEYISYSNSAFAFMNNKLYIMLRTHYEGRTYLFCYDEKGTAYAGRFTSSLYSAELYSSSVPQTTLGNAADEIIQKEK